MSLHYLFIVIWLLYGICYCKVEVKTSFCSGVDVKFRHQLLLISVMIIPIFILFTFSYISNYPTPENEYLTNYELAKTLELDNYTIKNYVVGLRARVN